MITDRRHLLGMSAAFAGSMSLAALRAQPVTPFPHQPVIPRWRGFNLSYPYQEFDFRWMAQWGFNFARLPLSYWTWADKKFWKTINLRRLDFIDQALEFGRRFDIHINLCLHRIPGYSVNGRELEPYQLFDSSRDSMERALDAAKYHWNIIAHRYKHIPNSQLSFDLFNEPPFMTDQSRYVEIARALITAIREVSPERLIFADGADIGQTPVMDLADQGIVQSTRGYMPKMVSHYSVAEVPANEFESFATPTWPMTDKNGILWNREKLRHELISKYQPLVELGVPIHVGEFGCYNKTSHEVCIAWMSDLLGLWKEAGWGWAMWNLRGAMGPIDSGRSDVTYERVDGHLVDRKMLDLLVAN